VPTREKIMGLGAVRQTKNCPNSEKPKLNQVLHQQGWRHNWKNMGKSKPWASAENLGYSTGYSVRYYMI